MNGNGIWFRGCYGINGFYNIHHTASGNDENVKKSRNSDLIKLFVSDFLPKELPRIPYRLYQIFTIRCEQLINHI